jgi:hypothetical protein
LAASVFESIKILMAAASAAVEAGNYALARSKAVAASALMIGIPDSEHSVSGGATGYTWAREAIDGLMGQLSVLENQAAIAAGAQSGGILSTKIRWMPPSDG